MLFVAFCKVIFWSVRSFLNVFPKKFYEKITKETLIPSNVNKKEFKKIWIHILYDEFNTKKKHINPEIVVKFVFIFCIYFNVQK